jgi:hypothetical protein
LSQPSHLPSFSSIHHHHDDVLDPGRAGVGKRRRRGCGGLEQAARGAAECRAHAEERGCLQELTSVEVHTSTTSDGTPG